MTTHISVRATSYRHRAGFLVAGTDEHGRRVSIFAERRDQAERLRAPARYGDFDAITAILLEARR